MTSTATIARATPRTATTTTVCIVLVSLGQREAARNTSFSDCRRHEARITSVITRRSWGALQQPGVLLSAYETICILSSIV